MPTDTVESSKGNEELAGLIGDLTNRIQVGESLDLEDLIREYLRERTE